MPYGIFKGLGGDSGFKIIKLGDLSIAVKFFNGFVNIVFGVGNNNSRWRWMREWKKGKCGDVDGSVDIESAHKRESNVETVRVNGRDDMLNIEEGKIKTLNMRKCK